MKYNLYSDFRQSHQYNACSEIHFEILNHSSGDIMNADLAAVFFSLILGISVYWIQGETEVIRLELNTTSLVGL